MVQIGLEWFLKHTGMTLNYVLLFAVLLRETCNFCYYKNNSYPESTNIPQSTVNGKNA